MTTVLVEIDGVDVTQYSVQGSSTRRLNRPSQAQVRLPMQNSIGGAGSKLKITIDGNLHHHGTVLLCETDSGEDTGYTVYNSTDPMELWQWRPVRDDSGDFTKPDIVECYVTGPEIMAQVLANSITTAGGVDCSGGGAGSAPPTGSEGPIFLDIGSPSLGGPELNGAPVDWPMTIAQLASLLMSTGALDIVVTPTDPGGGVMGTVDFYNGNYGNDLSGSVAFQYGMGAFNISRVRWNEDMSNLCNKLWYYAGPRIATAADPAGDQHWCFNVTGDDGGLCGNADTPSCATPSGVGHGPGGALPGRPQYDGPQAFELIGDRRAQSQTDFGVRMDIQIFDAYDDNCVPGFGTPGRELYRWRWQEESWIRAVPRELVHIEPTRETEIGTFDIGDLVLVEATAALRGGFSGVQRIFEYTLSWDDNGVVTVGNLQTSPTAEGFFQ